VPEQRGFHNVRKGPVARRLPARRSSGSSTERIAERAGPACDRPYRKSQNARDHTIAAAYSVRPTPDARVSAPLRWDEIEDVEPAAFTLQTMRARIGEVGDPMKGTWRRSVSLGPRFPKLGLDPP